MSDDYLHSIIADYGDACAEMQAELDRLRAEYDEMGVLLADKHNVISALRAELAAKVQELAGAKAAVTILLKELAAMKRADWKAAHIKDLEAQLTERRDRVDDLDKEIEALRKRFDDAVEAIDLKDKELIQERTVARDLRRRIAELENKNSYNLQIVREATARIAELEAHMANEYARCEAWKARAERAEAERDALHLFSGAQAAVIKEMREALELVLKYEHEWLAPSSLADVARAALNPSPAAKDVCK